MDKKYRFYEYFGFGLKRYLMQDGSEIVPTENRSEATLFTERDWLAWAQDAGLRCEEIGEDEAMRLIGAPRLPGMEG